MIIGPKGSGKTLHSRELAKKLGVFHISFRDRLQELIIAKTKKKIVIYIETVQDCLKIRGFFEKVPKRSSTKAVIPLTVNKIASSGFFVPLKPVVSTKTVSTITVVDCSL